jgi:hypothetical protein
VKIDFSVAFEKRQPRAAFRQWLAEPKLAERRLVGGEGFEPPTPSV